MEKKRILIGIAAMFAVVANFETKAAEPLPEHTEQEEEYTEPEIVRFMSDPWVMAEVSQAIRLFSQEKQEIVIRGLRVLQEFMAGNAVDIVSFMIVSGTVLGDVPQQMLDNFVEGFFRVLASTNNNERLGLLLAIAGCQRDDGGMVIEDVVETV
ncbi:MAG: hypothetical protein LBT03_00480 [Holosporales bacterium]|nr:hypothetical protein [Holosporales bacterium]